MSTDRELLEMAAKAIGMRVFKEGEHWGDDAVGWFFNQVGGNPPALYSTERALSWAPLTNDGDTLRLAVTLSQLTGWAIDIHLIQYGARVNGCLQQDTTDPLGATRRAIVRAAAEIGKAMP